MSSNLLSVNKFFHDNNCCFQFDAHQFKIKDLPTGRLLYRGPSRNGLYPLTGVHQPLLHQPHTSFSSLQSKAVSSSLWHDRLGHPNNQVLQRLLPLVNTTRSNKTQSTTCTHCIQGKMTKIPFKNSVSHACKPLEVVHSDVWGPAPVTSNSGYQYYVIFVNEFTRFTWFYPIKSKFDVLSCFVSFTHTMQNLLSQKIKILRTNCGGEYASLEFQSFCIKNGIRHQYTCPHTSEQNGLAERKHRHIVDIALTLISHSSLPLHFWPYAFSTAVYLINKLPPSSAGTTSPWERLFHRRPSYNLFKPFGCLCYPLLRPYNSHKLQPRSVECIFLGYATNAKGYICFDPKSRRYYTSRHVIFTESVFPFTKSLVSSSSSQISPTWLQTNLYFHECPLTSLFGTGPTSNTPSLPHILPSGQSSTEASSCSSQPESSLLPSQSESSVNPTPTVAPSIPFTSTELVSTSSVAPPAPPPPHHPMQTRAKSGIFKPKRAHHTTAIDYLQTEPPTFKIAS
jgi:hypothetical protein